MTTPHVEHYTLGLLNALARLGVEVSLVALQRRYRVPARQYVAPRVPIPRSRALLQHALLAALAPLYDVVHANNSSEGVAARAYDKLLVTQHGCPDPGAVEESLRWYYEKEARNLVRLYEMGVPVVAISEFSAREMREKLGVKAVRVVHHGLLESFLAERPRAFKTPHRLLWVSRFTRAKEPLVLLEAAAKLVGKSEFTIVMKGEGPLKAPVCRLVKLRGMEKHFTFPRTLPFERVPLLYRGATVYVHTCSREAFGFSVLEAMGSGLPVVVPDSGGAAEVVGDAGLKFKAGDSDDLADKLLAVMQDPDLYERLSRRSLERARTFTWEKAARAYIELYERVGG